MYILLSLLLLVLFVGALVDIIIAEHGHVKHLPKVFWIIIVILMPFVGSILWFVIGREYTHAVDRGGFGDPRRRREDPAPQQGSVVGSHASRSRVPGLGGPGNYGPRNTEAELAALEREISAYEKQERIRQLEAEVKARRARKPDEE